MASTRKAPTAESTVSHDLQNTFTVNPFGLEERGPLWGKTGRRPGHLHSRQKSRTGHVYKHSLAFQRKHQKLVEANMSRQFVSIFPNKSNLPIWMIFVFTSFFQTDETLIDARKVHRYTETCSNEDKLEKYIRHR